MILAVGLLAMVIASWVITGIVRRYALSNALVDVPNARSSHSVPTPRGGGFAIAVVTLTGLCAAWWLGFLDRSTAFALIGGGAMVVTVGWLDDHRSLSPAVRAIVHTAAAVWAVAMLGGFPVMDLGVREAELGPAGTLLAVVAIVWAINLYNFMDGIDGLAGSEAVTVGAAAAGLCLAAGQQGLALVAGLVAAASLGFTAWNWPPARIFMGDAGSGLLGFVFATLTIAAANTGAVSPLSFVLLLGVFAFDATATLLRRLARAEPWYAPHRLHAYQRLTRIGWSHTRVTLTIIAINVGLAMLALTGWMWPQFVLLTFIAGTVGLAVGYWWVERRIPMFNRFDGTLNMARR